MVAPKEIAHAWPTLARQARRIEAIPFDGHFLLHAPATGAVVLANATAMRLWAALSENGSIGEALKCLALTWQVDRQAASALVARLLHDWSEAGLFAPPSAPTPSRLTDDEDLLFTRVYRLGPRAVALHCQSRAASSALAQVLRPLSCAAGPEADGEVLSTVVVTEEAGQFSVWKDRQKVWGPAEFDAARHMALRAVLLALGQEERIGAVLHASCIALGDAAALLVGDSGAGKSTLMMEHVLSGARYVADDLVGLDRDGGTVWPFPVAVSLKPPSRALLGRRIRQTGQLLLSPPDDATGHSYVEVAEACRDLCRPRAALLCFPVYDARGPDVDITPLPPSAALAQAIESGSRAAGAPTSIRPLAGLCATTPALRLRDAAQFVRRELEARSCSPV